MLVELRWVMVLRLIVMGVMLEWFLMVIWWFNVVVVVELMLFWIMMWLDLIREMNLLLMVCWKVVW